MFVARRLRLDLLALVGFVVIVVGCSQAPTSPTSASAPVLVGAAPQASPPVPPRISVNPPAAVGLTRFVAFGDSITWGAYSSFDARFLFAAANGGYPERLKVGLNQWHPPQQFEVFNEGVPGERVTASATLTRFRNVLATRRPQAILLLEGINDLSSGAPVGDVFAGLSQLVTTATSAGVPVIVATMFQTYEATFPDGVVRDNGSAVVPDYNTRVKGLAGRINVHVLDLYPAMLNRNYVGNDGLHLTDAGFEVMAAQFLAAIERAFPVRGSFH